MTNVRETKRADELKPGDWTIGLAADRKDYFNGLDRAEILSAHPYSDELGRSRVLLVVAEVGLPNPQAARVNADDEVRMLTEAEIAEGRQEADRAARIAEIRALADWLEANPWVPMPYSVDASEHLDERHIGGPTPDAALAEVRAIAGRLDVKTDESLADRTKVEVPFGRVRYQLLAWHPDGRPADPAAEVAELRAAAKVGTAAEHLPDPAPEVVAAGMTALAGEVRAAKADTEEREGPWFEVGDRVTYRGWEQSQYFRAGLNVVGTVVETKPITGSNPARQQFRAEGADWCGGGSMWNHSDDYELAPGAASAE